MAELKQTVNDLSDSIIALRKITLFLLVISVGLQFIVMYQTRMSYHVPNDVETNKDAILNHEDATMSKPIKEDLPNAKSEL